MEFKKILSMRLFNISKFSSHNSLQNSSISPPSIAIKSLATTVNDTGDDGIFRRFLHGNTSHAPPAARLPPGENLLEKLRGLDVGKYRINLDAKKLLRLSELENLKMKLRKIETSYIGYGEFEELCCTTSFGYDQGVEMAKLLDQSGTVIVLGDVVFIRPQQIMQVIQGLIPEPIVDPRMKEELEQMEKQKAVINRKAESLVRRELHRGFGYLAIQAAVAIRLTFWELTWDVMEPICFYLTSMYFMAGYAFFMRTSKEPTFEGFYKSRFNTKQRHLMKVHNFDLVRYNNLMIACYPNRFPVKEGSDTMSLASNFGDFRAPGLR